MIQDQTSGSKQDWIQPEMAWFFREILQDTMVLPFRFIPRLFRRIIGEKLVLISASRSKKEGIGTEVTTISMGIYIYSL